MTDTREKRASAISLPWNIIPPAPDGDISSEADRKQLVAQYAGITGAPAPPPGDIVVVANPKITHTRSNIKLALIAGGAAGDHTVTGIKFGDGKRSYLGDQLIGVLHQDGTSGILVDLTSEFSITADNTINNTGGTATTSDWLIVFYADMDA